MKKAYIQPEIWVEELKTESPIAATNEVIRVGGGTFTYGGGGSGPARAGDSQLWDDEDEDDDLGWDQL